MPLRPKEVCHCQRPTHTHGRASTEATWPQLWYELLTQWKSRAQHVYAAPPQCWANMVSQLTAAHGSPALIAQSTHVRVHTHARTHAGPNTEMMVCSSGRM